MPQPVLFRHAVEPLGSFARIVEPGAGLALGALAVLAATALLELSRTPAGRLLGVLVAVGFAVFAVYSMLEARYRQVSSGA